MKPAELENVFRSRLGRAVESLTAREALDAMFAFYANQRAQGAEIDEDGDMLLYEWGVYGFGSPETFQVGVTRQFMVSDEDEPYQLRLTLHFVPTDLLRQFGDGNEWCHSPGELPAFRRSVESSAPFRSLADERPSRVELHFNQC